MDISQINDTLLKGLQQSQVEQVQVLTKVLGLKIGSEFAAQVTQLIKASPEDRAQLLQQINTSLQSLNTASAAPAVRNLVSQLLSQQTLVQQPGLQLVQLNVQGQPLLTYSDLPLRAGQQLLMRLESAQRLQILGVLAQTNGTPSAALSEAQSRGAVPNKPAPAATLLPLTNVRSDSPATPQNRSISTAQMESLRNAFIQLLPRKEQKPQLTDNAQQLLTQLQQLPAASRNNWLSSELQQALRTIANQMRTPEQMSQPKGVAAALKDSGVFFEHKLANLVQLKSQLHPSAGGDVGGVNNRSPAATTQSTSTTQATLTADAKGALLRVLDLVEEELAALPLAVTTKATATVAQTGALLDSLATAFAQMFSRKNLSADPKVARAQLLLLIQQHTLGSLAKIQLQQLHAINQQVEQTDTSLASQSWQMEVPVRLGQDNHPVHFRFDTHWVDDEDGNGKKKTGEKARQWQVMLSFDLPVTGKFFAQLTILNESLSASFWAEQSATLEKTREKLAQLQQQLEKEGLKVKKMHCMPGSPPQQRMSLGYSLVDVQT